MRPDFQDHVQVTWRTTIVAGLAFSRHAKPRIRIYARGNSQIDCAGAFEAALAPAVRACAGNREKTLLVMDLAAAAAGHTGNDSYALFRPSSVADFAEFQPRKPDFCADAGRRFFKAQFHIVPEVRATLRTGARAASPENILEAEKIAEDILKFVENRLIDAAVKTAA